MRNNVQKDNGTKEMDMCECVEIKNIPLRNDISVLVDFTFRVVGAEEVVLLQSEVEFLSKTSRETELNSVGMFIVDARGIVLGVGERGQNTFHVEGMDACGV